MTEQRHCGVCGGEVPCANPDCPACVILEFYGGPRDGLKRTVNGQKLILNWEGQCHLYVRGKDGRMYHRGRID